MDKESKAIRDIAFSCDDNGAKFLCVTVWSLLNGYRGDAPLRINVFEGFGGHSSANKAKLQAIVDSFSGKGNFSLRYHDVEPFLEPYKDLILNREGSRWNVFTWTPIFTPQILADATGNVIHLDIDMLVNADVSPLFELDLDNVSHESVQEVSHESTRIDTNHDRTVREDSCQFVANKTMPKPYLISAVAEYGRGDPVITEAVWGKGILPPTVMRYFNTGTIVFNAAACREERTWERILAWYRDHYDIADRIEQDAWNALYHDRTRLLPLKWNFHDRLIKSYPKRDPRLPLWQGNPPAECLEAALNPSILHFWGPKKPWKKCHRPYRKLYHEAMRAVGQTPPKEGLLNLWHDWKTRRNLAKIAELAKELSR